MTEPLVTVGIPTYNRPEELRRALASVTGQTYKNLEIIVSDNCSPNDASGDVVKEFRELDPRVVYYHQRRNLGSIKNMNFLLGKATGEYFMWLGDDDFIETGFIQSCLGILQHNESIAAVSMEAHYFNSKGHFDFFREGRPFYNSLTDNVLERLRYILRHSYGNMFYSLYRLSVLKGYVATSNNEIPILLHVASQGNWLVLPRVGIHKKTSEGTYEHARWEMTGGRIKSKMFDSSIYYHCEALFSIFKTIPTLRTRFKSTLYLYSLWTIATHALYLELGWKPAVDLSRCDCCRWREKRLDPEGCWKKHYTGILSRDPFCEDWGEPR